MAVNAPKPPPPPIKIEPGTVFIVNPGGAVHDVQPDYPSVSVTNGNSREVLPIAELAKSGREGWKLATAEQILAYCLLNNIEPPSSSAPMKPAAAPAAPADDLSKAPKKP